MQPDREALGRDALVALDRRHLWHPFTQTSEWLTTEPLVIERAEGFHLIDVDGRRYLDGVSSLWCNVHGHGHPRIVEAVKQQVERLAHSTLLGLSHRPAVELAARLVELVPDPLTRVFFSDSGSTAVEVALRIAFQYWRQRGRPEKSGFLALRDAYHGDTIGSLSLGFSEPFHTGYESLAFGVAKWDPPFLCAPLSGRGAREPAKLEEAARASLSQLEALLAADSERLAAIFVEPLVQGAAGIWPQPPSFVRALRELCDAHDVLLVCDEVATGFGRTGTLFAVEQAGIAPDILCLAKGISGGALPVAATLTSERIFDAFTGRYSDYRTLFHGHTYGGNPLGCAAALANIEIFEEEDTLGKAAKGADALARALDRFVEPLAHTGPVRQMGSMVGVDLWADPETGQCFPTDERRGNKVVLAAREENVIIRPLGDTLVLMPPLAMPPALIDQLVEVTARAITRATEG